MTELEKLKALSYEVGTAGAVIAELERQLAEVQRIQAEQESIAVGLGPILCRNQVEHPRDDAHDCLYCELTASQERERKLREACEDIARRIKCWNLAPWIADTKARYQLSVDFDGLIFRQNDMDSTTEELTAALKEGK